MSTPDFGARLDGTLGGIQERIAAAAHRSSRDADSVTLVAVTKAHPLEAARAAISRGLRNLGENRVDDLVTKAALIGDERVTWHMIGHVQRRQAPALVGPAGLVHSVDSVRLGQRLSNVAEAQGHRQKVLVQVNTSGEETKSGLAASEAKDGVATIMALPGLEVEGLMTMAPFTEDESLIRETFRSLRELQDELCAMDGYGGRELSMGMSNDFEIAIEEGSTMIRLGTALFGGRTA